MIGALNNNKSLCGQRWGFLRGPLWPYAISHLVDGQAIPFSPQDFCIHENFSIVCHTTWDPRAKICLTHLISGKMQ